MSQSGLRVGHGLDVHRLVPDRPLILGGVKIPYEKGLLGHSDADALVHALIDALLGATGRGDIGSFFPDTDPKWKDADSLKLLELVWQELSDRSWHFINMDATISAERPKLAPYIGQMKERLAAVLRVEPDCLGIKAGTFEGLGPIGRGEGIMVGCVVLLERVAEA